MFFCVFTRVHAMIQENLSQASIHGIFELAPGDAGSGFSLVAGWQRCLDSNSTSA